MPLKTVSHKISHICLLHHFLAEVTASTTSTERVSPKQDSKAATTLPVDTTTTVGSNGKQPQTVTDKPVPDRNQNHSHSNTATEKAATTASLLTTTGEAVKTSPKATNQPRKTPQVGRSAAGATVQSTRAGT